MAEDYCPECGCSIDEYACEKLGVTYCCEPCASGYDCECGCVEEDDEE